MRLPPALVCVALLAPLVAATDPLGDDAGLGRDASDDPRYAEPAGLGTIRGSLLPPADAQDAYALQLAGPTLLDVRLDAGPGAVWTVLDALGRPVAAGGAEGAKVPLEVGGRWTVAVRAARDALPGPIPYALALAPAEGLHWKVLSGDVEWLEMEIAWDQDAALTATILVWPESEGDFPQAAAAFWDVARPDGLRASRAVGTAYGARGATVEASPGGLDVALPTPTATRDDPGPVGGAVEWRGGPGTMRLVSLTTRAASPARLAVVSDAPFEVAVASGRTIATWDGDGALAQARAPGLDAALPAAKRDVPSDRPLYAWFTAGAGGGAYTDPHGARRQVGALRSEAVVAGPTGLWTFELGPRAQAGPEARLVHLAAVSPHRLGVHLG